MALLDWIAPESGLRIEGDGVRLRPPRAADFAEWRELRAQSKDFLQPWEPTWPADDLTRAAFRRRLAAYSRDREAGTAYPFFVFRARDGYLVSAAGHDEAFKRACEVLEAPELAKDERFDAIPKRVANADVLGQEIEMLLPAAARNVHVRHRAKYMAEPRTRPMGARHNLVAQRKDGTQFPSEVSLSPLATENGVLITSVIRDVSERIPIKSAVATRR